MDTNHTNTTAQQFGNLDILKALNKKKKPSKLFDFGVFFIEAKVYFNFKQYNLTEFGIKTQRTE